MIPSWRNFCDHIASTNNDTDRLRQNLSKSINYKTKSTNYKNADCSLREDNDEILTLLLETYPPHKLIENEISETLDKQNHRSQNLKLNGIYHLSDISNLRCQTA